MLQCPQSIRIVSGICKNIRQISSPTVHLRVLSGYNYNSTLSTAAILDLHPELSANQAKVHSPLRLLDANVAGQLASLILRGREVTPDVVFDCNAGPGVLSRQLLQQGAKRIMTVERDTQFQDNLKELSSHRSDQRIGYLPETSLVTPAWLESERDDQVLTYLSDLRNELGREPEISMFSTLSHDKEMRIGSDLVKQASSLSPLLSNPHTRCFIAITAQGYANFERVYHAKPAGDFKRFRSCSVLLQTLFDLHTVIKYDRSAFYPRTSPKNQKPVLQPADYDNIYVLELSVNRQAFDWLNEGEKVGAYKIFVSQMLQKRKARFIPTLELMVPECGLRLIDLGYTMVQRTGDVPAAQYLQVFKELVQWPEFESSPLLALI